VVLGQCRRLQVNKSSFCNKNNTRLKPYDKKRVIKKEKPIFVEKREKNTCKIKNNGLRRGHERGHVPVLNANRILGLKEYRYENKWFKLLQLLLHVLEKKKKKRPLSAPNLVFSFPFRCIFPANLPKYRFHLLLVDSQSSKEPKGRKIGGCSKKNDYCLN